jgi:hypothetical protein
MTMTPKEKAKELISLFNTKQYFDENKNVIYTFDHFTIDDKKSLPSCLLMK